MVSAHADLPTAMDKTLPLLFLCFPNCNAEFTEICPLKIILLYVTYMKTKSIQQYQVLVAKKES